MNIIDYNGKKIVCPKCNKENLNFEICNTTIHFGRWDCPKCGFIKWERFPHKDGLRTRTSRYKLEQVSKYHNYDEPFCFFCLRNKKQLADKQTLTIDHIKEWNKEGIDSLSNLQILCSACHKLKNWIRLYFNWHYNKEDGDDESDKSI